MALTRAVGIRPITVTTELASILEDKDETNNLASF